MMMRHFKRLDLQKLLPVSNLHILMVRDTEIGSAKRKMFLLVGGPGPRCGGGMVMVMASVAREILLVLILGPAQSPHGRRTGHHSCNMFDDVWNLSLSPSIETHVHKLSPHSPLAIAPEHLFVEDTIDIKYNY